MAGGRQKAKGSEEQMGDENEEERGDSTHRGPCRPLDFESESKSNDKPLESWYPFSLKKKKKRLLCFQFLFLIFTYLAPSLWHTGMHVSSCCTNGLSGCRVPHSM